MLATCSCRLATARVVFVVWCETIVDELVDAAFKFAVLLPWVVVDELVGLTLSLTVAFVA